MKYKFEDKEGFLELGISENSIQIELGRDFDEYYGGFFTVQVNEIDKLIKSLQELKDELNGDKFDTFKIIKSNN